jgi:hypothetical protein
VLNWDTPMYLLPLLAIMPCNITVWYVMHPTEGYKPRMKVSKYDYSFLSHKIRGGVILLIRSV